MHLNRKQFDVAVPGVYVIAMVTAAFVSVRLVVPIAVVGGLLTGILFALRDLGEAPEGGVRS